VDIDAAAPVRAVRATSVRAAPVEVWQVLADIPH
jgi:hypothetical protein